MVTPDHDIGLVFVPLIFIVFGAGALFLLNTVLKGIVIIAGAKFASQGPVQKAVQPIVAQYVKPAVDALFGTSLAAGFAVKIDTLLLASILVVLVGLWRTAHQQTEIAAKASKKAVKEEKAAKHD